MIESNQFGDSFDKLLQLQFDKPAKKQRKEYGLELVKSMWSQVSTGYDGYYGKRSKEWKKNRAFANGVADHKEFMDLMNVDGNKSYMNIDWTLLKIIPRYKKNLIGGFMERQEEATVAATDVLSKSIRERQKQVAKYRMANSDKIKAMEQMGGMQLEEQTEDFSNDQEIEIFFEYDWKLPEETFFEETTWQIMLNSDYDTLKRTLLGDLIDTNMAVTRIERLVNDSSTPLNKVKVRRCKPERVIYNVFESPIGEDVTLIGEAYPMKISELRRQYPSTDEQTWFKLAKSSAQKGLNLIEPLSWIDTYISAYQRPYDDYSIMVFDFEVKVFDKDVYVTGKNKFGGTIFSKKNNGNYKEGEVEVISKEKLNIYKGCWAINTETMLGWGVAPNIIRPFQSGVDCFSNYSIVIPDNDGTLIPSVIERSIPCARAMILASLKIQQMMASMKPDGLSVDVSGMRDLDIGTGEELQPMQLMKIYDQTGRVYWDSSDLSGTGEDGGKQMPIQNIQTNGNVAQLNVLIGLYNFWLERLNDEIGTNKDAMGMQVAAKRGAKVSQNQIAAANLSVEYLYEFLLKLMEINCRKIALQLWDIIVLEGSQANGENLDATNLTFDVGVVMASSEQLEQDKQQMISEAVQAQLVTMEQAFKLRHIKNVKHCQMYLNAMSKQNRKQAQEDAQASSQQNAQIQQQSAQMKSQMDQQAAMFKAQADAAMEKSRGDQKARQELVAMVREVVVECAKQNIPLPENIKPLADMLIGSIMQQSAPQQVANEQEQQDQQEATAIPGQQPASQAPAEQMNVSPNSIQNQQPQ